MTPSLARNAARQVHGQIDTAGAQGGDLRPVDEYRVADQAAQQHGQGPRAGDVAVTVPERVGQADGSALQRPQPVGGPAAAGYGDATRLEEQVAYRADGGAVAVVHRGTQEFDGFHRHAPGIRPMMWSRVQSRIRSASSRSRDTVSVSSVRSTWPT
jgi:hypothetical protein